MKPNVWTTDRLVVAAGMFAFSLSAAAAEPLQELFFVELPYAQEAGEVQMTLGTSLMEFDRVTETEFVPVLEYGFTDRFQATLEPSYASVDPRGQSAERGLGDVEAELLYSILGEEAPVLLSFGWGIGLPTGNEDKGLGDGDLTMESTLSLGKDVGRGGIYASFAGELDGEETEFHYGVAVVHSIGDWRPSLELSRLDSDDEGLWYLAPGLTRTGTGDLELALGLPVGLTQEAADWGVAFMLTYEFSTRPDEDER